MVVLFLATLPVQIGLLLVVLASEFTEDEWVGIIDFCEKADQSRKSWLLAGRFPE